jgi:hypothetical protein
MEYHNKAGKKTLLVVKALGLPLLGPYLR